MNTDTVKVRSEPNVIPFRYSICSQQRISGADDQHVCTQMLQYTKHDLTDQ